MAEEYDISKLLASRFLPIDATQLDSSYLATNALTGATKAQRYEGYLRSTIPATQQADYVFLSIGGSDGSEIEYVSTKFGFQNFILCEVSPSAAKQAEELAAKLSETGKVLTVVVGDIWDKRHEIQDLIGRWKKSKVVLSAQSVLHELPTRSTQDDFSAQLLQIISYADETILLTSDPTGNIGDWPKMVRMSTKRLLPEHLFQLSCLIHERYFPNERRPEKIGSFTYCLNLIALETFYKIAHFDGNARLGYELGECLSLFPRDRIQKILIANGYELNTQMWQSSRLRDSFNANFLVQDVESSDPLHLPETFLSIFAKKKL